MQIIPVHKIPARSCKKKGRSMAAVVAFAMVDDSDAQVVVQHYWTLRKDGYAGTSINRKTVLMHHLILPAKPRWDVSHENADPLDNQRRNLAYRTRSENMLNLADALHKNNTSKFRGVTRDDRSRSLAKPWRGKVHVNGKCYQTQRFLTPEEAHGALQGLRIRVRELPEAR